MNTNLTAAKAAKKDEFYTRLEDIEAELKHYPDAMEAIAILGQQRVSISLGLLLRYGRLAGELYDHMAEAMRQNKKYMRDVRDTAVTTLVELTLQSKAHKNDPAKCRYKNHITLDESLMMEIQDAASDYGYEWTY